MLPSNRKVSGITKQNMYDFTCNAQECKEVEISTSNQIEVLTPNNTILMLTNLLEQSSTNSELHQRTAAANQNGYIYGKSNLFKGNLEFRL